jgi:hypothetical protein
MWLSKFHEGLVILVIAWFEGLKTHHPQAHRTAHNPLPARHIKVTGAFLGQL